jgi:hypothetical protein
MSPQIDCIIGVAPKAPFYWEARPSALEAQIAFHYEEEIVKLKV